MTRLKETNAYRHVVVLLFLGYLLSFADRIVFGFVLKPIKAALALSDSQAGLLAGAAFAISYAVFSPLGGFLVDRRNRRMIFAFAVAFWSASTFACGLVGSALLMGLARAGVGAGEALLHPLSASLIGDTVPRAKRARSFGIYFSAGGIGTIAVLLFGGTLFKRMSGLSSVSLPLLGTVAPWQVLFMSLAVPGVLLTLGILAIMKEPPRSNGDEVAAVVRGTATAYLKANRGLASAFFLGYPLLLMGCYTTLSWVFVFFDRVHGWPASRAGVMFALTSGVTSTIGCLASGRFVSFLRRRGYVDASLRASWIGGVSFAALAALALVMPTPLLSMAVFSVASLFGYLPAIGTYSAVSEVVPPSFRAAVAGVGTLMTGIFTNSFGPWIVGFFSDHLFPTPSGIRCALLCMLAISVSMGTFTTRVGLRSFRKRVGESNAEAEAIPDAPSFVRIG